jgi:hypothetical protein
MSKQIILDALAAQFAVKQNEFTQYDTTVYQPALAELNKTVSDWFSMVLDLNPYRLTFNGDYVEITPSDEGKWHSMITIRKNSGWGIEKDTYSIDYRSGYGKAENQTDMYYLTTLGKVAQNIDLIVENMKSEWKPAHQAIYKPYYELSNELGKLESEINGIKQQIHSDNRETYKAPGFEHTVTSQLACKMNYDTNEYELKTVPYTIRLETGSGKWDYMWVNAYKVIGPAKYRKIAIQVKRNEGDERWEDIEVKGEFFDQFIAEVYNWETRLREKRDEDETKRYNKFVEAKQTA